MQSNFSSLFLCSFFCFHCSTRIPFHSLQWVQILISSSSKTVSTNFLNPQSENGFYSFEHFTNKTQNTQSQCFFCSFEQSTNKTQNTQSQCFFCSFEHFTNKTQNTQSQCFFCSFEHFTIKHKTLKSQCFLQLWEHFRNKHNTLKSHIHYCICGYKSWCVLPHHQNCKY